MILPELLADPVRARIYMEVLVNREVTAQDLMERTKISRSTLSHHLSRFVDSGVLNVRVGSEKYHRLVKYYTINPDYSEEIVIESAQDPDGKRRKAFLESSAAHLQVISHLILERANSTKRSKGSVTFTFNLLSEEEARIWNEEYEEFQRRVVQRCNLLVKSTEGIGNAYIAFGGLTPTR